MIIEDFFCFSCSRISVIQIYTMYEHEVHVVCLVAEDFFLLCQQLVNDILMDMCLKIQLTDTGNGNQRDNPEIHFHVT